MCQINIAGALLPSGSLTENYLPIDYSDVYALTIDTDNEIENKTLNIKV